MKIGSLLFSLICGVFVCYFGNAEAEEKRPHILVIMVDDMGYGDPSSYNSESKIHTPVIDSLARDGMKFTNAHAAGPLCHMSRYGLMTGRYPFRTDVSVWARQPLIEPEQVTIASLAKANEYRTAMVGKWHLGFDERRVPQNGYSGTLSGGPVDCGFDSFFGIRASTDIPPYFYIRDDKAVESPSETISANASQGWSPIQGEFWRAGGIAPSLELKDVLPKFSDEAIATIRTHAANTQDDSKAEGQPLMLYLAYPAPHTPWLPAAEFRDKSKAGMYGDFVMMVDAEIGRVLQALADVGWEEETLVLFTSDNGPVWYSEDVLRLGHDSTGGLRGMKADAWEGGHRMPFIVRWPNKVKPGLESDKLVCSTDILATMAELFACDLPDSAGPDSFSFLNTLLGKLSDDSSARNEFVMQAGGLKSMMTIQAGGWKLITGLGSGGFSKPRRRAPDEGESPGQLYHLSQDPFETTNLYQSHPDKVRELQRELERVINAGRSR